jgi:hypothetical protein
VAFRLENTSSAAVTGMTLVKAEGSPALQLERAGVRPYLGATRGPLAPLADQELEQGDFDDAVTLVLRHGISCPTPVGRLDAVWIRYTVLGMEHEQRVPLVDGPSVVCR